MTREDPGGGALTGATGDLTPDNADQQPFIPAEQRAMLNPEPDQPADDGRTESADPPDRSEDEQSRGSAGESRGDAGGDDLSDHEERL